MILYNKIPESSIKKITAADFDRNGICVDEHFAETRIFIPEEVQKELEHWLENSDGTKSDRSYLEQVEVTVSKVDMNVHYAIDFENEMVDVSDEMSCQYLDNLVLEYFGLLKKGRKMENGIVKKVNDLMYAKDAVQACLNNAATSVDCHGLEYWAGVVERLRKEVKEML